EQIGEGGRLDQRQDHRHVPGPLGDDLPARLPFVLERLQLGYHHGEQLHDDRGGDVGHDPQGEHGELLEGSPGEQIQEAIDPTRLLLGLEELDRLVVDTGDRDRCAEPVDSEHRQREEDLPPEVRHLEHVAIYGEHPDLLAGGGSISRKFGVEKFGVGNRKYPEMVATDFRHGSQPSISSAVPPAASIFSLAWAEKAWALTVRARSTSPSARTLTRPR